MPSVRPSSPMTPAPRCAGMVPQATGSAAAQLPPPPAPAAARPAAHPGTGGVPTLCDERVRKRRHLDGDARARAMADFAGLVAKYFFEAPAVAHIVAEEGPLLASSASLAAALEPKKTATLAKRVSSLRLYASWFETTDAARRLFATEPVVYRYFVYLLSEGAPASRASALREALNFVGGIFAIDVSVVARSARVRGLSIRLLRTRGVLRQRGPLSVRMVMLLEGIVVTDAGLGSDEAIIAGAALFCLYGRARVGDLAKCAVEPRLDLVSDGTDGFVDSSLIDHKTARPGSKQALPVVAPARGVSGRLWAPAWLMARRAAGLSAARTGTLLQALGMDGNWTSVPYLTLEFAAALRAVLRGAGIDDASLGNVGAHSLKATTLSWMAKAGIDRDTRRVLGYHIRQDERSMEAYSRDSLAGPLRSLSSVVRDIAAGRFLPDATRSGSFPVEPAAPAAAPSAPSSTCSSARSSSSSSSSPPSPGAAGTGDVPAPAADTVVILNLATKFYHIARDEESLRCGKPWPLRLRRAADVPRGGTLCHKCF